MSAASNMVNKMAIVLLFAVSLQVSAQIRMEPPPPPKKVTTEEEKARQQSRWMNKNLDLELEQYMKVNNINLTYARRLDSLNKLPGKGRGDYAVKMKTTKEAELKAVLTPDQYKIYIEHREKPTTQKKSPFLSTY